MATHTHKRLTTEASASVDSSPLMIPTIITPRGAIAYDLFRIVYQDCEWKKNYKLLSKLLLVCKEWFEMGSLLLWKNVTIKSSRSAEMFLECIQSSERGHLYKRALQTINLETGLSEEWIKTVFDCLETGTQSLTGIHLSLNTEVGPILEAIGPCLRRQIESVTMLRSDFEGLDRFTNLKRICCEDDGYVNTGTSTGLIQIASGLTHLTLIDWGVINPLLVRILESAMNLEQLVLGIFNSNFKAISDLTRLAFKDPSRVVLPKLKSMALHGDDLEIFVPLLERHRNQVTEFELYSDSITEGMQLISALSGAGDVRKANYTLKDLGLYENTQSSDFFEENEVRYHWKNEFHGFSALESLRLSWRCVESELMQLADACGSTLRRLVISHENIVESDSKRKKWEILRDFLQRLICLEIIVLDGLENVRAYVDGLIHPTVVVVRIRCRFPSPEYFTSSDVAKIWKQCPNLVQFWFNDQRFERIHCETGRLVLSYVEQKKWPVFD